tara:strand:+ start:308 stop:1405 length:1098 start_codon:yes stop_codon:yes gene_type:complete
MSRGKQLQEMDPGTKQSKTAVNANAKAGEPIDTSAGNWEDLGGPTPENYKVDDDSAKLKTPGGNLKQVSDVVTNRKGKTAKEDVELEDQEIVSEEPATDEEVVAENEAPTEEVVAEEETVEEYDMEEDVNALLGGEDLSEDFKAKAKTIFEAAINAKVAEVKEALEAEQQERIAEEVEAAKESLAERVDSYLEYVADEWFEENQIAVENGLKSEMTESFLEGMKSLFEEHYVQIPEDKYDVLESMVEKLDDMETKLNEQIEKNIGLNRRLAESVADGILETVSDGLASTQKEKLASLAESVEFESEESYRDKLETLKESYFASKPNSPQAKTETLSEGVDNSEGVGDITNSMSAYLRTLGSFNKN